MIRESKRIIGIKSLSLALDSTEGMRPSNPAGRANTEWERTERNNPREKWRDGIEQWVMRRSNQGV